jgi:hypothetical protein
MIQPADLSRQRVSNDTDVDASAVRRRRRRVGAVVLAACLIVGLAVYGVVKWTSHGDPDPGGRILAALQSIDTAVPAGATGLTRMSAEPHWDSCDGREGTFGWSVIGFYIEFNTTVPAKTLLAIADGRLAASGWQQTGTLSSPLGLSSQWTRTLADGTIARSELSPGTKDNGQTISWSLYAVAPPHGQLTSGC